MYPKSNYLKTISYKEENNKIYFYQIDENCEEITFSVKKNDCYYLENRNQWIEKKYLHELREIMIEDLSHVSVDDIFMRTSTYELNGKIFFSYFNGSFINFQIEKDNCYYLESYMQWIEKCHMVIFDKFVKKDLENLKNK